MTPKRTAKEIANIQWVWEKDSGEDYTNSEIATAVAVATAQYLNSIDLTLKTILYAINSLGQDGLHTVIQDARREVQAKEKHRKQVEADKKRAALQLKRQRTTKRKSGGKK